MARALLLPAARSPPERGVGIAEEMECPRRHAAARRDGKKLFYFFVSLIVSSHCAVSACVRYWAGLNHGLFCTHKQTLLMEYGPSVVWLGDREAGEQRARQRNTRRTKSSSLSQSPITHACAPAKPEQDKNCRRLCCNKY